MGARPSLQYRVLGLAGALEAGFGLWWLTNGHWVNGIVCAVAVAAVTVAYIRGQRRLNGKDGGRRY